MEHERLCAMLEQKRRFIADEILVTSKQVVVRMVASR